MQIDPPRDLECVDGGKLDSDGPSELAESTCQSFDWYAEGESRTVQVGDVEITVQVVARKGRRTRLNITAPMGAVFQANDKT